MCEIMTWSDDKQNKIDTQKHFHKLLNPKQNENSHNISKGADAVKLKSEVPRSRMMRIQEMNSASCKGVIFQQHVVELC